VEHSAVELAPMQTDFHFNWQVRAKTLAITLPPYKSLYPIGAVGISPCTNTRLEADSYMDKSHLHKMVSSSKLDLTVPEERWYMLLTVFHDECPMLASTVYRAVRYPASTPYHTPSAD
jgi:hypothetical protein